MKWSLFLALTVTSFFSHAQDPVFVLNPEGHASRINRLLVTHDRTTLVSFGDDKSICFWDARTGALIKKKWLDIGPGESGRIIDADLGAKTDLLAVARINSQGVPVVHLIDFNLDKVVGTYTGFSQDLGFVRMDPSERYILTGSFQHGNYHSEGFRVWKIPPFSNEPFSVDKPAAQGLGAYVHDTCFYNEGGSALIVTLRGENVGLEIKHDPTSIPEYTLSRTSPIIKQKGHVKYLHREKAVLFASHTGEVYKVDASGKKQPVLHPKGWQSTKAADSTVLECYVSPSQKIGITLNSRTSGKDRWDFYELFDIDERKIIRKGTTWFQFVNFLSDSVLVGVGEQGLFSLNFCTNQLKIICHVRSFVEQDDIQFGTHLRIAFNNKQSVFDFTMLEVGRTPDVEAYSGKKTSYEGVGLALMDNGIALRLTDRPIWFFPTDDDVSAYSYTNNGKIVVGRRGYRTNRNSLLLYDTKKTVDKYNVVPELAFEGNLGAIISIAPAPIEKGLLFATRDRFGIVSVWNEETDQFHYKFKNRNHYWPFENFNLDVNSKDDFTYALPRPGYRGALEKKDKIIGINDFTPRKKQEIIPYLESLGPEKPVSVKAQRGNEIIVDQLTLNKLKYVSPLVSVSILENEEWLCWTPQGYYASSAGGEKFGGWVISERANDFAEFHPMYDFKKQFYRPEFLKLVAREGSFKRAVDSYNLQAEQPIAADGSLAQKLPPSIEWLTPGASDTLISKSTLRLTARVRSSTAIQAAKILLNGRTVLRRDQIKIQQERGLPQYLVSFDVDLPSLENTINVFAENENGSTVSEERVLRLKQLEIGIEKYKPNLYLLSVGVSGHSQAAYNLSFADKDASAMAQLYEGQKGTLFKNVFARTLVNDQATRANILEAFYWLEQNATQKDVVIIFIASHGLNEKDKFYILPHDGDPERIRITGVDWLNFSDVLGNLPSKVLVFIDACHSGKLGTNLLAKRGETDLMEAIRALATEENGVVIMAASTGKESSFESEEWQHGAFTLALLEGMRDGKADLNEDGIVNIREIDYYVAERVKELTKGKQHPTTQKPSIVSEFPLLQIK